MLVSRIKRNRNPHICPMLNFASISHLKPQ
jgi:hypothetical protein